MFDYVESIKAIVVLDEENKIINLEIEKPAEIELGEGKVKKLLSVASMSHLISMLPIRSVVVRLDVNNKPVDGNEVVDFTNDNFMNHVFGDSEQKPIRSL